MHGAFWTAGGKIRKASVPAIMKQSSIKPSNVVPVIAESAAELPLGNKTTASAADPNWQAKLDAATQKLMKALEKKTDIENKVRQLEVETETGGQVHKEAKQARCAV